MRFYDEDGCYCLLIAILIGVGANRARLLYEYGPNHPACKHFIKQVTFKKEEDRKKRMKNMKQMRENGCSIEMLAAIFDCDSSTVKRSLKKMEEKTNDVL